MVTILLSAPGHACVMSRGTTGAAIEARGGEEGGTDGSTQVAMLC